MSSQSYPPVCKKHPDPTLINRHRHPSFTHTLTLTLTHTHTLHLSPITEHPHPTPAPSPSPSTLTQDRKIPLASLTSDREATRRPPTSLSPGMCICICRPL